MKNNEMILILSVIALTACATAPQGPTEAQVKMQHDASTSLAACANTRVASVDDYTSDASTIAMALHATCSREYASMVDAFAAPLNPAAGLRFKRMAYSENREIEMFLPTVLEHRKRQQ